MEHVSSKKLKFTKITENSDAEDDILHGKNGIINSSWCTICTSRTSFIIHFFIILSCLVIGFTFGRQYEAIYCEAYKEAYSDLAINLLIGNISSRDSRIENSLIRNASIESSPIGNSLNGNSSIGNSPIRNLSITNLLIGNLSIENICMQMCSYVRNECISIRNSSIPWTKPKNSILQEKKISKMDATKLGANDRQPVAHLSKPSPTLCFEHFAKTGGNFISGMLDSLKYNISYRISHETFAKCKDDYFIVGSIRDPCSYYVSLWSYGVQGKGQFARGIDRRKYYGSDVNDASKFRLWLQYISGFSKYGIYSYRYSHKYGHNPRKISNLGQLRIVGNGTEENQAQYMDHTKAHCWVHTATLIEDLRTCLEQFEAQNPKNRKIPWDKFEERIKTSWHNAAPHNKCSYYFDSDTRNLVRSKESVVIDFLHETCCGEPFS